MEFGRRTWLWFGREEMSGRRTSLEDVGHVDPAPAPDSRVDVLLGCQLAGGGVAAA